MTVALYCRVSTTEQADNGHSIEEQIDRLTLYCQSMGWTVFDKYIDAGFSGAKLDRPDLKRLIRDVKAGKLDRVLVYKLDRLSRSQKDTLYLIEDVFLSNSTDFVSMSENFDTSSPFGKAMIGILAVFAQLEREMIKERMAMGIDARAKKGLFQGSIAPIGYAYENGELIVDEFEMLTVKTAFELAAANVSPLTIARTLNAEGLYHRNGKWSDDTIRKVLRNKTYCGYIRHRKGWMPANHQPIVTEEDFEAVQKVLDRRQQQHFEQRLRYGKATTYFGGLIYCARCGKKLCKCTSHHTDGTLKAWYGHRKRTDCNLKKWAVDELDSLIFDEIRKLTFDVGSGEAPKEDKKPIIEAEIKKLDEQISRLIDLYAVGKMPIKTLEDKIAELNEKKSALEDELEEDIKMTGEEARQIALTFDDVLQRGTFDEIRSVLTLLIEKVELDGDDVIIHWNFT
jgi:site-specific DNA recombinase